MKWLTLALAAAVALIQYPLWLGKGGWLRVWEVDQQISAQHGVNTKLQARNDALEAEVRDLKQGFEAIEERARSELGMIRHDEIFFQVLEPSRAAQSNVAASERGLRP
jgi:cell division protein FtsB